MGYVRCKILLTSLVILDLCDIVNDNYIKLVIAEEFGIRLWRSSYDLDLIDPSVVYVIYPYQIDAVLKAQDIVRLELVAVVECLKEIIKCLRKAAFKEIREFEYRLVAEQSSLGIVYCYSETDCKPD